MRRLLSLVVVLLVEVEVEVEVWWWSWLGLMGLFVLLLVSLVSACWGWVG